MKLNKKWKKNQRGKESKGRKRREDNKVGKGWKEEGQQHRKCVHGGTFSVLGWEEGGDGTMGSQPTPKCVHLDTVLALVWGWRGGEATQHQKCDVTVAFWVLGWMWKVLWIFHDISPSAPYLNPTMWPFTLTWHYGYLTCPSYDGTPTRFLSMPLAPIPIGSWLLPQIAPRSSTIAHQPVTWLVTSCSDNHDHPWSISCTYDQPLRRYH